MDDAANKYAFAIGKQIKQIFTESELYLDGLNNMEMCEESSIRRIDRPLFLLLEDGNILRLYGTSFSIVDDSLKEYVFSESFHPHIETQLAFQFMCDRTILNVQEYKVHFDCEEQENNLNEFAEPIRPDELSDIAVVLDNGTRLVCRMFFDYFDIQIVE